MASGAIRAMPSSRRPRPREPVPPRPFFRGPKGVVSVRDSGGTIYLNFGRRWSEALTVTILKQNVRSFAVAGIEPRTLEGRVIKIRGFIEVRNGPVIEASRPEQIEVAAR